MNQKNTKNSFFNLPSSEQLPDFALSLQLIDTINIFSHQQNQNLQTPQQHSPSPHQEDDSLAGQLSPPPTLTHSNKKKKTGCSCKKTLCLKMYCECFSTGKVCGEDCSCTACKNTSLFPRQINAAKVTVKEGGLRNCSLAEKRCNCKKSHCQKRYCECFNSGVGCTPACKCEDCSNKVHGQEQVQAATMREFSYEALQQNSEAKVEKEQPQPTPLICHSMEDIEQFYS